MKAQDESAGRPVLVGITGGIGCGKSAVANVLVDLGVPVLDADDVARDVVAPGSEVFSHVVGRFGDRIVAEDGSLDRDALGAIVFRDGDARAALNAMVHPPVMMRVDDWMAERRRAGASGAVVIPLLYEIEAAAKFDAVVCVSASEENVMNRLAQRGLTREQADERLRAQWPLAEKESRADVVIRNDGSMEDLKQRTIEVWNDIRK